MRGIIQITLLGFTFVLMGVATAKADTAGINEVILLGCPELSSSPTLDANSDDPCWPESATITQWFDFGGGESKLDTEMKVGYNRQGIYIFVLCHEKEPDKIKAAAIRRQDGAIWEDDSLEIFISPVNSGPEYKKFSVNSIGTQVDYFMDSKAQVIPEWRPEKEKKWRVAAKKTAQGWCAELELPWSDIGEFPKSGDVWTFGLLRFSWVSGSYVADKTSPGVADGAIHKPKFGYIAFGSNVQNAYENALKALRKRNGANYLGVVLPQGRINFQTFQVNLQDLTREIKALSDQSRALSAGLAPADKLNKECQDIADQIKSAKQNFSAKPSLVEWKKERELLINLKDRLADLQTRIIIALMNNK